jgi:hypothetical protein
MDFVPVLVLIKPEQKIYPVLIKKVVFYFWVHYGLMNFIIKRQEDRPDGHVAGFEIFYR